MSSSLAQSSGSAQAESPKEGRFNKFKGYRPIHRKWPKKARKATWALMILELAVLVPILVIFGIAQPDLYRSDLWSVGYQNKLNSNPNMIIYAFANHKPQPRVPLVWSQTLTDFNVAISIISLFFLLSKLIAFIMKVWYPIVATVANIALVALYAVSTYGQIGPDYADERYPSPAAWYFRKGCDLAKPHGLYKSCQIAQSSLGITILMLCVYIVNLSFCVYAMWPDPANNVPEQDRDDELQSSVGEIKNWELQSINPNSKMMEGPFTPRTQAFHTLDRQLPLRSQQAARFA